MPTPDPLTPLVVRFGAFGDMLLLIPMLKVLHRRYGRPCDLVSSGRWTTPLMQRVPACGPVQLLTSRRTPYWFNRSQWELVAWLKKRPPGPVYVFEPDEKAHWLLRRGGVKPEWICSLRDLSRHPGESIMHHALRLARETPAAFRGSSDFPVDPAFAPDARPALTEADQRDCQAWLSAKGLAGAPLVLLQPGNKKTMKGGNRTRSSNVDYWPESHWAQLIAGVRRHLPASRVILCGSPAERPLAEDIVAQLPEGRDGVVIATDDLPIPRLLTMQTRAHSMISVNTGPAHGAAAMGCPLVVLFTRHQHRAADMYAPQATSAPVKILFPDSVDPEADLASITPDTVIGAWQKLVAAG
ncbi:MAG TPA: glycosyltransferase family 9 protein [Lacunisphaera sp.]|nr:glycosyltransferase family 9 protein [Lacunisphaera sp.]